MRLNVFKLKQNKEVVSILTHISYLALNPQLNYKMGASLPKFRMCKQIPNDYISGAHNMHIILLLPLYYLIYHITCS